MKPQRKVMTVEPLAPAVQLKWSTWGELTSLAEGLGLKAEGGFINAHGHFVSKAIGVCRMGAQLHAPDGTRRIVTEGQWVVPVRSKRIVEIIDDLFHDVPLPEVKTIAVSKPHYNVIRTVTLPPLKLGNPQHYGGRSFGDVMASVREGIAEAKAEMGIE